ncbi:hypothetical protein HID58_050611 [Brassica napus]|uniref:Uncharacterized protein n=1 Tax=Brassica napus TaxID=3708 RepID=A0ABQ8A6M8_BRANA|nr:hypothetical protein HID58_050611 [Brassica napus]
MTRGSHLLCLESKLLLNLVKDRWTTRVSDPKEGVPRFKRFFKTLLYVLGDEPRDVLEEMEGESHFPQVSIYGSIRVGKNGYSAWITWFAGLAVPIAKIPAGPSALCAFLISSNDDDGLLITMFYKS